MIISEICKAFHFQSCVFGGSLVHGWIFCLEIAPDAKGSNRVEKSEFQLKAVFLLVMFLSFGLAACGESPTSPAQLENLKTLGDSLERSGASFKRVGKISADLLGHEGRIFLLNGDEIEVYEFSDASVREELSRWISSEGMVVDGEMVFWDTKPAIWGSGALIVVYRGYDGGVFLLLSSLLGDPLTYEPPAEDEPYPPSVVAAIRYLADDLGVDPTLIQVLDFNEVDWPDTCLGASETDEKCIQRPTPGWRIMMKVSGDVFELRTDVLGAQIRPSSG